uniref:Uncharacterized protein n=1 Tax=Oryzias sinensis TaxID=183150 RepID=A0A8C7WYQ2_9TELE
ALLSSLHLLDVSPTFWLFTCFGLKLSSFSRKSINRVVLSPCFQVTQATNQIVMNCADIDIITASFAAHGGDELNATGFNYQNEDEKVTLSFPSALQKGRRGFSRRVCLENSHPLFSFMNTVIQKIVILLIDSLKLCTK